MSFIRIQSLGHNYLINPDQIAQIIEHSNGKVIVAFASRQSLSFDGQEAKDLLEQLNLFRTKGGIL